jgi:hypothetical protein
MVSPQGRPYAGSTPKEAAMRNRPVIAALAAALLLPVPAGAEGDPPPSGAPDNFLLAPAEGPQLKIDRRDGRVSVCDRENGEWRCRLVPDDREAYEGEIARLEKRIDELERKVAGLESDRDWIGPNDEKKLDEFLDFTDKAFRRFFGMVRELEEDMRTPDRI